MLVEHGTLTDEHQIISDAVVAEILAAEHARRREMQARAHRVSKFEEMTAKAP